MARIIHNSFGVYRAHSEGDRGASWAIVESSLLMCKKNKDISRDMGSAAGAG